MKLGISVVIGLGSGTGEPQASVLLFFFLHFFFFPVLLLF